MSTLPVQLHTYTWTVTRVPRVEWVLQGLHGSRMIFPWAVCGWVGVGWMDGRMTPVSIPTGERKSLSEHNRKETEQKQAHVFLDIKSLPVKLWAASPTILSIRLSAQFNHHFGRQRNWSSLFIYVSKKNACSCGHTSHVLQLWVK